MNYTLTFYYTRSKENIIARAKQGWTSDETEKKVFVAPLCDEIVAAETVAWQYVHNSTFAVRIDGKGARVTFDAPLRHDPETLGDCLLILADEVKEHASAVSERLEEDRERAEREKVEIEEKKKQRQIAQQRQENYSRAMEIVRAGVRHLGDPDYVDLCDFAGTHYDTELTRHWLARKLPESWSMGEWHLFHEYGSCLTSSVPDAARLVRFERDVRAWIKREFDGILYPEKITWGEVNAEFPALFVRLNYINSTEYCNCIVYDTTADDQGTDDQNDVE